MSLLVRTNRTKLQKALSAGTGVVTLAEADASAPEAVASADAVAESWITPEASGQATFVSVTAEIANDGASAVVSLLVDDGEDEGATPVSQFGGDASGAVKGSLHGLVPAGYAYYVAVTGDSTATVEAIVEQAIG